MAKKKQPSAEGVVEQDPLELYWSSQVHNLFQEIVVANKSTWVLRVPLLVTYDILREVAYRCSEINDPILNGLMCRLTLYAIADPCNKKDYDPVKKAEVMEKYKEAKRKKLEDNIKITVKEKKPCKTKKDTA